MSKRTSIVKALAEKFKVIDGVYPYKSNIFGNAEAKLKFWDECVNFPCLYVVAGSESREYMPGGFTWGFLGVSLKVYAKGEDSAQLLEDLLEDIENVIGTTERLVYDPINNYETTEILISSITTDEGLLSPYAIGEINLQVRYQVI